MKSLRNRRTGPSGPVRIFSALAIALATAGVSPSAAPAHAEAVQDRASAIGQQVADFYRARDGRPLWFDQPGRQADLLLGLLASAEIDGLDPRKYRVPALAAAVEAAKSGDKGAIRRADLMLSQAFVDYVRDLRQPHDVGTLYVDAALRPTPTSPLSILEAAARSTSLERHVATMRWMHPLYGQLRNALSGPDLNPEQRQLGRINLERARELPAGQGRHIIVNTAAQRLFMYEGGREVDSMRVVVGKPKYPTPMMAAYIRYAALNPYWFVPPDLAAERIAPSTVKLGVGFLEEKRYQVVTDFVPDPTIVDPSIIDWKAVAAGTQKVLIRQLPGPANAMGRMKFMFPNSEGVYLHDTPDKELLSEAARLFSGGCVRLEDAARLGRWLFGRELEPDGAGTEAKVMLHEPVPVYLTYLTAVPSGSSLTFYDDIYGRDRTRLAQLHDSGRIASLR